MKPFLIGLTGSIGMGKSTTAQMFARQHDVAIWDADAAVHRLYSEGGAAVAPIAELCPEAAQNGIDRAALKQWISRDPAALKHLEKIVHPLVAEDRAAFIAACPTPICVLDIPLLFETGGDATMDLTVVVSTDALTQKERVMARGTMSEIHFNTILQAQMPDAEKRSRADYVIDSTTMDTAQAGVDHVLDLVRSRLDA